MPEPKPMSDLAVYRDMTPEVVWNEMIRARREESQQKDRIHALEVQQADLIRQVKEKDERIAKFATLMGVPDAGRYRNDWESRAEVIARTDATIKTLADAGMAVIGAIGIMTEENAEGVTARLAEALPRAVEELLLALRIAGRLP